jgi:predicted PhzF superfamily epimerase YddE/YHI9
MQKIAAENRHSETAFVVPRADGDFDLRWFTPKVEDDLCGHATLASAYVLALRRHNVWPVRFHTRSGMLTVAQDIAQNQDGFVMDFPAQPPQPCEVPAELLPALGLKAALVMKSRDYLVVVDHAEQVRALSPILLLLPNSKLAVERLLRLPAKVTWITCAECFCRRPVSMRTPQPAPYAAHWLHIGRDGWVRTRSVRDNSAPVVDTCSAQSLAIA